MKTTIHVVDINAPREKVYAGEGLRLYCETGAGKPFTPVARARAGALGI